MREDRTSGGVMSAVPMMKIQGVREPKDRGAREARPIPGLPGFAVTRTCLVRSLETGEDWDAENWPATWIPSEDGIVRVDVIAAAAMAWTSAEARAGIRSRIAAGADRKSKEVTALAEEYGVSNYAVCLIASKPDEEIVPWALVEPEAGGDEGTVENAEVEHYAAYLHEKYRPPSRGGNTSALHVHVLAIGGEKFSFFARGSRKWVFAGDRVSFTYRVTPEGYRNIRRQTIVTVDGKGHRVVRGDRRSKKTLRTATLRPPGSRREWRD